MTDLVPFDSLLPPGVEADRVLPFLARVPGSYRFIEYEPARDRSDDGSGGGFEYQVKGSKVFINLKEFMRLRGDLLVAAAAFAEQSIGWPTWAAGVVGLVAERVQLLTDEQVRVLNALRVLAAGKPYQNAVAKQRIVDLLDDSTLDVDFIIIQLLQQKVLVPEGAALKMSL